MLMAVALAVPAAPGETPRPGAALHSLQGTVVMITSEGEGLPFRFWAKGPYLRMELAHGPNRVVTLQRSNVVYTYLEGSTNAGTKASLGGPGLASLPLLAQIEEIKARGVKGEPVALAGEPHDRYDYGVHAPQELAVVFLCARTGLPRVWVSSVATAGGERSVLQLHYRDLQANGEIPDRLFQLPAEVVFEEQAPPPPSPPPGHGAR